MRTFYYSILFSFLLGGVSTSPLNADYYCGTPIVEQDENEQDHLIKCSDDEKCDPAPKTGKYFCNLKEKGAYRYRCITDKIYEDVFWTTEIGAQKKIKKRGQLNK